jgi:D-3-phosphoglycerate dehydrogenase / 2-oxoglutarate reductase
LRFFEFFFSFKDFNTNQYESIGLTFYSSFDFLELGIFDFVDAAIDRSMAKNSQAQQNSATKSSKNRADLKMASTSSSSIYTGAIPGRAETVSPLPNAQFLFKDSDITVVLFEKIDHSVAEFFASHGFNVREVPKGLAGDELIEAIKDAQVIGIRSKTKMTEAVLRASSHLLAIGCFCIGTNQVDLQVAKELGIPVFNSPFENTRSVAELIIGEIIALSRFLCDRSKEMHDGQWAKTSVNCHEIRGKKLGIVGYGHIGSQLSVLAESMGMRVYFHDIERRMPLGNSVPCQSLDELLTTVDFVTLHVPATEETHNLMNAARINLMRRGSYLLNASRGSVVDLDALAEALRSGHLRGAAVDVFPVEPKFNCDDFCTPIRGLPNVIMTPHTGGSTEEAQVGIGRDVSGKLLKFVKAGKTVGAVNFPNIAPPRSVPAHRITNVHANQPGFLKRINSVLAEFNVTQQILRTDGAIGYLLIDFDTADPDIANLRQHIASLDASLRTRLLW